MFNIVEKSNTYLFEDDLIPHSPRVRSASYDFAHCLHIVLVTGKYLPVAHFLHIVLAAGKYRDIFTEISLVRRGSGERVTWEDLSMKELLMGKIIPMKRVLVILALFKNNQTLN